MGKTAIRALNPVLTTVCRSPLHQPSKIPFQLVGPPRGSSFTI
jgi:hypothetical protein